MATTSIRHLKDLPQVPVNYGGTETMFGRVRDLEAIFQMRRFGVDVQTIAPGEQNAPYHVHEEEEEFFLVLEGTCKLLLDGEHHDLTAGDCVYTRPGQAHCFYNDGLTACMLLVSGTHCGRWDATYLPGNPLIEDEVVDAIRQFQTDSERGPSE
jgi:uncharacterized cupin superfamily protein